MAATDLGYLERFCKGDRARMEKYICMYLNASPGLFAQLQERLSAGDAEALAVSAHSLRPQVNYMGAQGLFDLLTAIEHRARAEGAEACAAQVAEACDLNEKVMAELRSALGHP
ncbi:MAG: Hpt domain-containing protein [Flavobacteriales bacterium]|nr:Hpt domain-containing protein [Flavobacteriales bacterium]